MNGLKHLKKHKKFIYLISPNKIKDNNFYLNLEKIFRTNKIVFFQLRLKKEKIENLIKIGKRIKKICKKHKVKFIINDNPFLAKKINADGCHLGQKDMNILDAKRFFKKKIIGITCHNSLKLAKIAKKNGADYLALGAFNQTNTKKVKFRATIKDLKNVRKFTNMPIVAIGGINNKNYKKLLLNNANFLAISGYIWNNKKLNPLEAVKKLV